MTFKPGQKVRILPGNDWFKNYSIGTVDNPVVDNGISVRVTGELTDGDHMLSLWIRKIYLAPLKTYKITLE